MATLAALLFGAAVFLVARANLARPPRPTRLTRINPGWRARPRRALRDA